MDIEKNIIDTSSVDIHSNCATTWSYNDVVPASMSGVPSGPSDVNNISNDPALCGASLATPDFNTVNDFSPSSSSPAASWGSNNTVASSYAWLGAVQPGLACP